MLCCCLVCSSHAPVNTPLQQLLCYRGCIRVRCVVLLRKSNAAMHGSTTEQQVSVAALMKPALLWLTSATSVLHRMQVGIFSLAQTFQHCAACTGHALMQCMHKTAVNTGSVL
jgi:hypothetical protein